MKTLLLIALAISLSFNSVPNGTYAGTKSILGETINGTIIVDSTTAADIKVTGAATIDCEKEAATYDGDKTITLPNMGKDGDCVHDQLASNNIELNSIIYDSAKDNITLNLKYQGFLSISFELDKVDTDSEFEEWKITNHK